MGIRGANQIHPGLDAMDRLVALELAAKRRRQGNDRQRPTEKAGGYARAGSP